MGLGSLGIWKTGYDYVKGKLDKPKSTASRDASGQAWENLLQRMGTSQGKEGVGGSLESILQAFKDNPKHLKSFMETAAPFLASSLEGTKAFQDVQSGAAGNIMGAYGGAAGQIGTAAQQGLSAAQGSLGRSGLARSGAMASLSQQAIGGAGAQQANLYSNLYQTQLARRADLAQRGLDAHRNVASLALGMNPQVRQPAPGGAGWGQIAGTALGAAAGGSMGGPGGAMVGSGVGGALGTGIDQAF